MRIASLNRWAGGFILTLIAALLVIAATKRDQERLRQLACAGSTESDAPVKASLEVTIQATPEKVWSILTDHWPKWQTNITESHIEGPLQSGTEFTWRTGGTRIKSQIALVQLDQQLSWTGSAFNAHAIHIWRLQRLPNNTTLLKTDESMSGFLLSLFYSSKDLQEGDQFWLDCLKREAERREAISN
jgi:uncharacterized protein YndB with AHSA1/START domain